MTDDTERYYAEMEALESSEETAYFNARPDISTWPRVRQTFRAGFERAFKLLWKPTPERIPRQPDGYAYRRPSVWPGTESYIAFDGGGKINGSEPIAAVPYWFGYPPSTEELSASQPAEPTPQLGQLLDDTAAFKNFHRSLCKRFGYPHDEKDWRRDQVSLIEHIAARLDATTADATRMRRTLQNAGYTDNGGEYWKPPLGKPPAYVTNIPSLREAFEQFATKMHVGESAMHSPATRLWWDFFAAGAEAQAELDKPQGVAPRCPGYWDDLAIKCQLQAGHEGECYFIVPSSAINNKRWKPIPERTA